jgi:MoaA/NifB/PqqE/SkfB family radical SAM enzyme
MRSLTQLKRDGRMYLSRRFNRSLAPPDRVSINLTLRCNLKCSMCTTCYDSPELSTDEIKGLIDQVAAWGVEVLNPLGGEPFVRTDLEAILAYAVRRGFYVTLTTNGTLITAARARLIAAIPSDRLHFNLSLDGRRDSNDAVRGKGSWEKAIEGYRRIRSADSAAGNSRRKILANTLLHAGNLDHFEEVLDEQEAMGLDGVQILTLFRTGPDVPAEAAALWLRERHMVQLESLVERLAHRSSTQSTSGYRIQNTPEELLRVPSYYRDGLKPMDAPCWAGWKELYINADGQAIMCDGKLDFLAGGFGNIRRQTLRELWSSPALRQRREVVRKCSTPCIQKCYQRKESDSARVLASDGLALVGQKVGSGIRRLVPTVREQPEVILRAELSDVHMPSPLGHDQERWSFLTRDCPEEPGPDTWHRDRDHGYLDFGRGFMGFELLRQIVEDIRGARLRLGCLDLSWRGEPLLHPEILPILRYLGELIRSKHVSNSLRLQTDGRYLNSDLIDALRGVPMTWVVDLDRGRGAGMELLKTQADPHHRVVALVRASDRLCVEEVMRQYPGLEPVVGRRPSEGHALWVAREDSDHFLSNAAARERLEQVAIGLGVPVESGDESRPRRCIAADQTPVISWDGKIVLCPSDVQLQNKVGDLGEESFTSVWSGREIGLARTQCESRGVPDRSLCRDCPMPWSPNHGS